MTWGFEAFGLTLDTVHRDSTLWGDDANEFNPDRWQSDGMPVKGSYFPFSYGPRNCLGVIRSNFCFVNESTNICSGQELAILEITLTLATLFRRYDLQLDDGYQMDYLSSFTLCARDGLKIRVATRQK